MWPEVIVLMITTAVAVYADINIPITGHWSGGFQGKGCFDITQEMHSWTVTLTFDQPLTSLDVYTADIVQTLDGGKVFVLHNKAWNKDEHVGDQLCIEFQGHGSGDISPVVTGALQAGDVSGNPITGTPTPTATTSTTTSSTTSTTSTTTSTTTPSTTHSVTPTPAGDTSSHSTTASASASTATPTASALTTSHSPRTTLPPSRTYDSDMVFVEDKGDFFYAEFKFTVDEEMLGWIVNITFDGPINFIESGNGVIEKISEDKLHWTMVSFGHQAHLPKGSTYLLFIAANYHGHTIPHAHATMTNMGRDKWSFSPAPTSDTSKYNYNDVLFKSILFYEAQRTGKLPATNRLPYRNNSLVGDKGDGGEDLSGGYFVGHGHVKFNFPIAYSATILSWGYLLYEEAYKAAGQEDHVLESIKWALDYLIKCHTKPDELYVQVSDYIEDYWAWNQPEFYLGERPPYKINDTHPGTDIAMETAAAFAAGSLAFKTKDPSYSATLLTHAKQLWDFGNKYHGLYSDSIVMAAYNYSSHGFNDEICWSSLWLYQATNDNTYLTAAEQHFDPLPAPDMSWDNKTAANQVLLYKLTKDDKYKTAVEDTFHYWFPGGSIPYTPKGLAHRSDRAALSSAANMAMLALIAADAGLHATEYRHWAMCQIHYALGDTGFSYVVGFGDDYPLRPYQRISMCPNHPAHCSPEVLLAEMPNIHILYGALVGGPGANDEYLDKFDSVLNNEVTIEFNAGFQTAVAALKSLWIKSQHPEQLNDAQCPYIGGADVFGRR
ncbi:endoglucanase A-like [Biomphalaria glabrata]|uniref:cellulase n=1 Tax=Biomphalaria glabrata TaxID=6526 RepID=A0A9W2ZY32_BIOGL|nr:endoglucanase A-like [Biomphalaria glabrata]XP_055879858.1 endoglucanase A-like [Biomphalaria glabrata]